MSERSAPAAAAAPARIFVVFASRNGASRALRRTLTSLAAVAGDLGGGRVVGVDSASTDATYARMLEASDGLPLTVLRCEQPGKNRALNLAVELLVPELRRTDLLVFTDDDVLVDPDWLRALRAAAAARPEALLIGGAVEPLFPHPPDRRLLELSSRFDVLFARLELPEGWCAPEAVYGPNMLVRAAPFLDGARFEEGIGPDGTAGYAMGSETELARRLARGGARMWHAPQARVRHLIKPEEMAEAAVLQRARRHARGAVLMRDTRSRERRIAGVPLWILRGLVGRLVERIARRLTGRRSLLAAYEWCWFLAAAAACRSEGAGSGGAGHSPERAYPQPGAGDSSPDGRGGLRSGGARPLIPASLGGG